MGKNYMRIREVVYTLSPNEVEVMSGLWKDADKKILKKVKDVSDPGGRYFLL
jgi:hypothetical protein